MLGELVHYESLPWQHNCDVNVIYKLVVHNIEFTSEEKVFRIYKTRITSSPIHIEKDPD